MSTNIDRLYTVDIAFDIVPTWRDHPPQIRICLDDRVFWTGEILERQSFSIGHHLPRGQHRLSIEFYGKTDLDPNQAIAIESFALGGIPTQKAVWLGIYRPRYPEPWASQQRDQGIDLRDELTNTDFLGWNGVWHLDFSVPVFTWIHQIENLGWIYD